MTTPVRVSFFWLCIFPSALAAHAQDGSILARVRARGYLRCGVDRSEPEYSSTDEHGTRVAFDREICKAIAAAALGPEARIALTLYADDTTSLHALADDKADLIASLSNDAEHIAWHKGSTHIGFTPPILYDPVSVMVPRSAGLAHASQLSGKLICLLTETHTQDAAQSWFREQHLDLLPFPFQEEGEMEAAFVTDRCIGIAGDRTRLIQTQHDTGSMAEQYTILPEILGDDTLAIAYPLGDSAWEALLCAVRSILLAEPHPHPASSDATAPAQPASPIPTPSAATLAHALGLRPQWVSDVMQAVGSYQEIFHRSFQDEKEAVPLEVSP